MELKLTQRATGELDGALLMECRHRGLRIATSRVSVNNLNPLKLAMRFGSIILDAATTFHRCRPGPRTDD